MSISPETIDQIRLASDITEIVREYVPTMKKAGRNWKGLCPFHHEKTPSFMVSPEKGIFHCFGCHAGGDVYKFVMLIDGLSWVEAVKKLAQRAGITIKETREETIKRSEKQKLYDILEQASLFYNRCLTELAEASAARNYLKERGITEETIEKFRIGFAPQGHLLAAAEKKGTTFEQMSLAGLFIKTERGKKFEYMGGRIVFPIFDTQGRIVAFGGRTLKDEQPKYLNTPETTIYSKSAHLYGLHQALPSLRTQKKAVILEGYMDVVVTHQGGVPFTVATLGTALTPQHTHLLNRYAENIVLLFDSDNAGIQAARRAIETFLDTDSAVRIAHLPDGVDPDEYILQHSKDKFLSLLDEQSVSAIEFLTEQSLKKWGNATPEAKVKSASDLISVIAKVKNTILRREWTKYAAEKIGISEDAAIDELRKLSRTEHTYHSQQQKLRAAPKAAPFCMRSAEEELLQLLGAYPHLCTQCKEGFFKEERNTKIFMLLSRGIAVSDIVNHLDENDIGWFTELLLEEKHYATPEQTLQSLMRGINLRELEIQRQQLEKEVILMLNGQVPMDDRKKQLYEELNKQLKGSVKS